MTGPIVPLVVAFVAVYGGAWVVRTLSAGWTSVRANKSITQFSSGLARAAGKEK